VERVKIVANLRHDTLEAQFNEETIAAEQRDFPFATELYLLWDFGWSPGGGTCRQEPVRGVQIDYSFYVENERVRITTRKRGAPNRQGRV
jgi:exoribonuclease-2